MADNTWADVHPHRLDALVEGRDFYYGSEDFVSRSTFQSLSERPRPGEDGLHGTGGSVSGDELFLDIALQKTMMGTNTRYGVIARMQRREDFDGRFDRQLIGLLRRLGEDWDVAFLSDLSGDKAQIDFQYEANWRPRDDQFLRLAFVQTDNLYNAKTDDDDNKYRRTPTTWFAHYRHPLDASTGSRAYVETAFNYSPRASFEDRAAGELIEGTQLRAMAAARLPLTTDWQAGARVEAEHTDRDVSSLTDGSQPRPDFERRMYRYGAWVTAPRWRGTPKIGMELLRIDEDGWFGRNLATGEHRRREVTLFVAGKALMRERSHFAPILSLTQVDYVRDFVQRPDKFRDEHEWMVSLAAPWRYEMDEKRGAIITVNPTFRLHPFNFGGGNIQVHWPL